MVVMGLWWIGGNVLIYLAGLKGIPQRRSTRPPSIDGASGWARLGISRCRCSRRRSSSSSSTGIIGTFQIFTTAFILIGKDAADGRAGTVHAVLCALSVQPAFGKVGQGGFQMGYASALAWILFIIILLITLIQLALARRWVYYETDK